MASIREHKKKDGSTTYYVLWRDPDLKKQTSLSVDSREKANELRDLLNLHGQRLAVVEAALQAPAEVEVLTLRDLLEAHLGRLTKPTAGTITGYRRLFQNRLGVTHGGMPASDFTEEVIAEWMRTMVEAGATRKTIANTTGLLSSAFKSGVRRGLVDSNPFDFIELPDESRTGRRTTFLTKGEYDLIRSHMNPHYSLMVDTDLGTGMRFGEITALYGSDLDLTAEIPSISVDKAWKEDGQRRKFVGPPKSATSIRSISITRELSLELLEAAKKPGLVFTGVRGTPVTSKVFHRDAWGPAVAAAREAGLRKTPRFHDLRHTHASWLLQEGVPIFVVSRRLGHASVDITTKLYGHITPEGHRQAVLGMEKALGRS